MGVAAIPGDNARYTYEEIPALGKEEIEVKGRDEGVVDLEETKTKKSQHCHPNV